MKKTYMFPTTEVVTVGTKVLMVDYLSVQTGSGAFRVYDSVD